MISNLSTLHYTSAYQAYTPSSNYSVLLCHLNICPLTISQINFVYCFSYLNTFQYFNVKTNCWIQSVQKSPDVWGDKTSVTGHIWVFALYLHGADTSVTSLWHQCDINVTLQCHRNTRWRLCNNTKGDNSDKTTAEDGQLFQTSKTKCRLQLTVEID